MEIRLKAIQLWHQKENVSLIATELNIPRTTIHFWKKMYNKGDLIGGKPPIVKIKKKPAYRKLEHKFKVAQEELKEARLELRILRKGKEYLLKTTAEKYEFIYQNKSRYSVAVMCRAFEICASNYHRWCRDPVSIRKEYKSVMIQEIKKVFNEHQGRYGSRRIAVELQKQGYKISQVTACRYMKEAGLKVIGEGRYSITTTPKHLYPVAENKLMQWHKVSHYNEIWVSDIMYVRMGGYRDWLFLTVIIDLFDRKIIGWSLSESMKTKDTTILAFEKAERDRPLKEGAPLIFHSDGGAQYACNEFTSLLRKNTFIVQSMNRKKNLWDKAVTGSFFSILKLELINKNVYKTKEQAEASIYDYIENYYNKTRRHIALDNKTITEFHELSGLKNF
ncbi:IS3 family transposase [Flavobacterium amniphilum]|nr:IS3 family transposase [Flavobacterium amniphilum]